MILVSISERDIIISLLTGSGKSIYYTALSFFDSHGIFVIFYI